MNLKERFLRFRSFWIYPLIAVALIYLTFSRQPEGSLRHLGWLLPLGLLGWTLLEYGLHRFVFHIDVRSVTLRKFAGASHLSHHAAPRDPDKLLVHTTYGLVVSALVLAILYSALGRIDWAAGMMSGIWAGFLYYELVHYRVHLTAAASGLLGRQRRAHFYHHFINNERCFGVTTPLWDYVFRTQLPQPQR